MSDRALPQEGELWRHYKGGQYVIKEMDYVYEATLSPLVLYRSTDPEKADHKGWARTVADFMSDAKLEDGTWVPRFTRERVEE